MNDLRHWNLHLKIISACLKNSIFKKLKCNATNKMLVHSTNHFVPRMCEAAMAAGGGSAAQPIADSN